MPKLNLQQEVIFGLKDINPETDIAHETLNFIATIINILVKEAIQIGVLKT